MYVLFALTYMGDLLRFGFFSFLGLDWTWNGIKWIIKNELNKNYEFN